MPVEYTHKRGDSLVLRLTSTENGTPTDLTGYTITASVFDRFRSFIYALNVVIPDASAGKIVLSARAIDTRTFPRGRLYADVRLTQPDGVSVSSETFYIEMVGDAAYPELPEDSTRNYGFITEPGTENEDFGQL